MCRNDAFLDFAGLVGEGVGDVVTVVAVAVAAAAVAAAAAVVVVVGYEGVDDAVEVVPVVGGYYY